MNIFYKYSGNEKYWALRAWLLNRIFFIKKNIYSIKSKWKKQRRKADVSKDLFLVSLYSVLSSFILVILIICVELLFKYLWTSYSYDLSEPTRNFLLNFRIQYESGKNEAVTQFLSTVAGVSGVVLALFFSVLVTIASTAYSKVQSNVRDLLLSENYTQSFLKQITFLTSVSILFMLCITFSYKPNVIAIGFVGFNIMRSLYTFIKTGMKFFQYFDPSNLMHLIANDLINVSRQVTYRGFQWDDPNFQAHNRQLAYGRLQQLKAILDICSNEKYLREDSLIKTYTNALGFLGYYIINKSKIPLSSGWFPLKYSHKTFFLADSTSYEMSEETDSFIQPNQERDHYWIENYIVGAIFNGFKKLIEVEEIELVSNNALTILNEFSKILGENGDFETSKFMLDNLGELIRNLVKKEYDTSKESFENSLNKIVVIQNYSNILTNIMLGFFREIEKIDSRNFDEIVNKINWSKKDNIYKDKFFRIFYHRLENIQKGIIFEMKVEGKMKTPVWYIKQCIAGDMLDIVNNGFETILNMFENHLKVLCKFFEDKKQSLPLLILAHIGLHICWKFERNLQNIEPILKNFNYYKFQKDINWTVIDYQKLLKQNNDNRAFYKELILNNILSVSHLDWNEKYLDIFGESYKVLCRELNDILYFNKEDEFKKYFPKFFNIAFTAFEKIREYASEKSYNLESFARLTCQTVIDLLELSGLAYVYSDIYDNPVYKQVCFEKWENVLNKFKNENEEKTFVNMIILHYAYSEKPNFYFDALNHRKFYRERALVEKLRELRIVEDYTPFLSERKAKEAHKSILIELLKPNCSSYSLFYDPAEIFIEMYLFTRMSAKNSVNLFSRKFFSKINNYVNHKY